MPITKQVLVACDTPGCQASFAHPGGDTYAATQAAKKAGWAINKDGATCPVDQLI